MQAAVTLLPLDLQQTPQEFAVMNPMLLNEVRISREVVYIWPDDVPIVAVHVVRATGKWPRKKGLGNDKKQGVVAN